MIHWLKLHHIFIHLIFIWGSVNLDPIAGDNYKQEFLGLAIFPGYLKIFVVIIISEGIELSA